LILYETEFVMKKRLIAAAALAMLSVQVMAQESPWLVRARAVHLGSANTDTTGLGLNINNKDIPEVDISYFISPNVAAELILTVPQKHTLKTGTGAVVGTLKHLPPTLTLQYHFTGVSGFKPYVGAGVNFTQFSGVELGTYSVGKTSTGGALQLGVDFPIDKKWSFNIDVKKVYIGTTVYASGVAAGQFKVDPLLVGAGLGYRF
jgi:outer membrane protein